MILYTPSKDADPDASFRVLLAEDDHANALVTTTMLDMFGFDYHPVTTGADAFAHAKSGHYAILILDVRLPLMDGLDAARAIRAFERETNRQPMQIICVTANALSGERERCLEAGCDDYLSKPFDFEIFRQKLAYLREKALGPYQKQAV